MIVERIAMFLVGFAMIYYLATESLGKWALDAVLSLASIALGYSIVWVNSKAIFKG